MASGARRKTPARPFSRSPRLAERVAKHPNGLGTLYNWFDAVVEERGPDVAIARLRALSNKTKAWGPALALGYCLFGLGETEAGVRALREAYRRKPGEKTLYALSGALLMTDRVDEAVELLQRHDKSRRITARPLVNLANAYLAQGEAAKAEGALRRISAASREDWDELVDSAWQRLKWGAS
jgi:predicted Zn-dependent protease